ncbi:hypothetical protein N9248_02800 [bacterium]|nr:hypothetical protein [bacterium]
MISHTQRTAILIIAAWFSLVAVPTHAQNRVRGHVVLPSTSGATVLSTYINASANRAVAIGDFLESAAIARQIHLESDRLEMENSIKWVETYFERRKLNREYRDELRKDYQETKASVARAYHKRITHADKVADPTRDLNYMLNALIGDKNAFAALFVADTPVMKCDNMELTADDVSRITIDSGSGNKYKLGRPVLVDTIWPKAFDAAAFDEIRFRYDAMQRQTQNEIGEGNLSLKTFEELNRLLAELSEKFDQFYTWQRVKDSKSMDLAGLVYFKESGNRFVQTQRAGALRAFSAKDPSAYELRFQFDRDTLTDLLRYCSTHHVKFASPESPERDVYARLYQALRVIYLEFITDPDNFLR